MRLLFIGGTRSRAPESVPGFHTVSIECANAAAGFAIRPIAGTIRDTILWRETEDRPFTAAPDPVRERELLAAYDPERKANS